MQVRLALALVFALAAAATAAPAPFAKAPKPADAPTYEKARQQLAARGVYVTSVTPAGAMDEWDVSATIRVGEREELHIVRRIRAQGPGARVVLEEMLRQGHSAQTLRPQPQLEWEQLGIIY